MTVTLTEEQADRLDCVVRSGAYASCDDILQEALELWLNSDAALPGRLALPAQDPFSIVDDAFRWPVVKPPDEEQASTGADR